MSLAFWRRKQAAADAPAARTARPADDDGRNDPAAALRVRARRRLIGAAALLLAAVIAVPMVLDPEPKPVADNIPIDIPGEKTKFSPRLSLPPVAAPEPAPPTPPPDAAPAAAAAVAPAVKAIEPAPPKAAPADEQRARAALEGKVSGDSAGPDKAAADPAAEKSARSGKFAVQAAATSNLAAARELSDKLKKAGLTPYTERIDTAEGTRYRVRVGPYATREEADKARARLKSLGISGNIVAP